VLKEIRGSRKGEQTGCYITAVFCVLHWILLVWLNPGSMWWVKHVAVVLKQDLHTKFCMGKESTLGDEHIDEKIILKSISRKYIMRTWIDSLYCYGEHFSSVTAVGYNWGISCARELTFLICIVDGILIVDALLYSGVLALAATQQYFLLSEVALRILPALCQLTVDPEKSVRDNVFRTIKGFLGKLEKVSEDPSLRESMGKCRNITYIVNTSFVWIWGLTTIWYGRS